MGLDFPKPLVGTNSQRPAAGLEGRLYYDTTYERLLVDTGAFWVRASDGMADDFPTFFSLTARDNPDALGASFSRGSVASFLGWDQQLQEVNSGTLRRFVRVTDERGNPVPAIKLEASRTNELHNSDSPATQTRSLGAGDYVLWIEGTGSVDASGATDGSYGTATESNVVENDLTFTVTTTQDVTFTVNGSVDRFQCEAGDFRSSFITTAGAAVTRSADSLSFPFSAAPQEMTVYGKLSVNGLPESGGSHATIFLGTSVGGGDAWLGVFVAPNGDVQVQFDDGSTFRSTGAAAGVGIGDVLEYIAVLNADGSASVTASVNGGAEVSSGSTATTALPSAWSSDTLWVNERNGFTIGFNDFIALKIAPAVKTMAEMRALAGV